MNAAPREWNQSAIAAEDLTPGRLVELVETRMAFVQCRLELNPSDSETDRLLAEKTALARARHQLLEVA
jgi:hypothetical protein